MLNEAQISLSGYVATQPVTRSVKAGATNVSMRVAWTERRRDRVTGEWVDGNTSYVTVICWRKLGANVGVCVRKGDPIVVKGKLSVRSYNDRQGALRTVVEVEASSVGHDLSRGVASFQRVRPPTGMTATEYAASMEGGERAGDEAGDRQAGQSAGEIEAVRVGGQGPSEATGAARDGDWHGPADEDAPMPDEPDEAFFDEAAISALVEGESAAAGS